MQKLFFLGVFLTLGGLWSCSEDEGIIQEVNEEVTLAEYEKVRSKLASDMSVFTIDAKPILHLNGKSENGEPISFEEFKNALPDGRRLTEKAESIAKVAYDFNLEGATANQIEANYDAKELISLAEEMKNFSSDTEFETVWNEVMIDHTQLPQKDGCGLFCKVWNGIKAAAKWVWDNIETILKVAEFLMKL